MSTEENNGAMGSDNEEEFFDSNEEPVAPASIKEAAKKIIASDDDSTKSEPRTKKPMRKSQVAALFDSDDDEPLVVSKPKPATATSEPVTLEVPEGGPVIVMESAGIEKFISEFSPEILSANNLATKVTATALNGVNLFLTESALAFNNSGGATSLLQAKTANTIGDIERQYIDAIINCSSFDDETTQNNAPHINIYDAQAAKAFTAVLVRTQFVIPAWTSDMMDPDLFCTVEYQKSCQPGPPTIWTDSPPGILRFTKQIIPLIYKVTVQFKVTEITKKIDLHKLERMLGVRVDKALLLERTKRNMSIKDATIKCKSILAYHNLADGSGMLVINVTVALNTAIPSFAAKLLNGTSGFATTEVAETAKKTRAYLASIREKRLAELGRV